MSEVPEFEDPNARERAEKGELVLTKLALVGPSVPAHEGLPERRKLHQHITCWWDPDTDELWDQETFCKLGEKTSCWEHGNCVVKKSRDYVVKGRGHGFRGDRGARLGLLVLRDAVERALWEQEKTAIDRANKQSYLRVCRACEADEEIAALKKKTASLAEENADLRHQLEELRQQFNTFSLTLTSPFDSLE